MRAGRVTRGALGRRRVLAAIGFGAVTAACGEAAGSATTPAPAAAGTTDVSGFPAGETRPAPDFAFEAYQGADLVGGQTVQFSQILAAGKPVVLNFWAAQCPPCRVEMPEFDHAWQAARDRVLLVGLDVGPLINLGTRAEGEALAEELGVTYPVGTTSDATVMQRYKVLGMPSTLFITTQSQIHRQWTGILDQAATTEFMNELVQASGG
ncbi:MAG: TlpA disulfide reductase family protein [Chloroflexi bacterium]|nr:TlpA disulfide reductase family protein [Chloroflexota bacterium]MCY3959125.1 TlpA disulfide reductase family protein [Chloroflexota bacterium]